MSVPGVYRDGRIELTEPHGNVTDGTPVIVTFLENGNIDLRALGITEDQARDLRRRLAAFEEDWNSPEMTAYDDYDGATRKK